MDLALLQFEFTWPSRWTPAQIVHVATLAPLFMVFGVAAVIDWHKRRIPNWLTLALLAGGILRSSAVWTLGLADFTPVDALLGVIVGFLLAVPLFVIGARGAGDAKLYIASGAWVGWSGIVALFLLEAIVGLLYVIGRATLRRQLRELLRNTGVLVLTMLHLRRVGTDQARDNGARFTVYGRVRPDEPQPRFASIDRPLPHAVPFLAAALLAVFLGKL